MRTDYQQMETGGDDNVKKANKFSNFSTGNISNLMKSRITAEIPPKSFISQFKWIFVYMFVISILIIIFIKYYFLFGLINLSLDILGTIFLTHGIIKKKLSTYKIGTGLWILEFLAISAEIVIYALILFGQIFAGNLNFILGLLKFVGITVLLLIFLIICAFFTYQIMRKKHAFENNNMNTNNYSNYTQPRINFSKPVSTPGTIAMNNK